MSTNKPVKRLTNPHKISRLPLTIFLLSFIVFSIFSGVVWYTSNNKVPLVQPIAFPTPTRHVSPSPTNTEKVTLPDKSQTIVNYFVKDNKIYWVDTKQKTGVFMDIHSFPAAAEIFSIASVTISPDRSQLLIVAHPGYGLSALFTTDLTNPNPTQITTSSQEWVWSPSGRYIAYTRLPTDSGPAMLFIYDTASDKHVDFNVTHKTLCLTSYSDLSWTDDEKAVIAHYQGNDCNASPQSQTLSEGQTKLYLQ